MCVLEGGGGDLLKKSQASIDCRRHLPLSKFILSLVQISELF